LIVSLIAAMDEKRGIGLRGSLPWHLSSDLKRFKSLTTGHHIVMGRKTYQSIGRPLPGRTTVIVSRNKEYAADGCLVAHSLEEALDVARRNGEDEAFVIGGGEIFDQALPFACRLYLTTVHVITGADVFFPELRLEDWQGGTPQFVPAGPKDDFDHTFTVLTRIKRDS
jgi:dihydrofolate reductase